jgi:hypothetical protein
MFKYSDGSEIMLGDSVLFENGKVSGVVELLVQTEDEMAAINVNEPGIMLNSTELGLTYHSAWHLTNESISLVSRAPSI